ncbi:hypothetical protein OsI_30720 [Oryza sativa Indica Group]|uniref:Uncharacterized protein n=2 Tax=Oryza sativa TaxID=4530 RepID=A3BWY1_ORYSJ|nr:hypothetical protein OsI_30720 [Oryza sativa Indica Group]EAZ44070.1 hypothetical protein OsJ_28689 [Oryza sativa Japonica Group]BAD28721.1 hypothetical protein [Oryza sativa Japonica Group]BAD29361.1 hypothetical protein [Oryza sativa Japonica Group]
MAVAASLLLEYVSRSLRWPIPRALKELLLSPHCLKESPRWLYSSRRCWDEIPTEYGFTA